MSEKKPAVTNKEKAEAAISKIASYGQDIDLNAYVTSDEGPAYQEDPSQLPAPDKERMLEAGVILDDVKQRSATYIQKDNTPVHFSVREEGVEVMPVAQALEKYDWAADYADEAWTVPVNLGVAKTIMVGKTPVGFQLQVIYYIVQPDAFGPHWGLQLKITPVVPNVLEGLFK